MLEWLRVRLRGLFRRDAVEAELDRELRFHVEKATELNINSGMSEEAARLAALRTFGGVEQAKERTRDVRAGRMIEEIWKDLGYAVRMVGKSPGFAAVVVLSLGLGIGANAALFSVADTVLLKELPVKEPDRLVLFKWQAPRVFRTDSMLFFINPELPPGLKGSSSFDYRIFRGLRERLADEDSALSDLFAFEDLHLNVVKGDLAEKADGQAVSGGYFSGLGVQALQGRAIAPADDDPAGLPVVVLSYRYWRDRFGADPAAIGQQILLNGISFTIVGVTPPAFSGTLQVTSHPDLTVPMAFKPALDGALGTMNGWSWNVMGRLKAGATLAQAGESLNVVFQRRALEIMPPPQRESEPAQLEPKDYPILLAFSGSRGMPEIRRYYSMAIYLLFGAVGLVLLIACSNIANLLLARGAFRSPELAVRFALGAGRRRLVRLLLTETLLLSAIGGGAGIALAWWGTKLLGAMNQSRSSLLPPGLAYALDWRVLSFALGVTFLTAILFGLAPALRATRLDVATMLKQSHRGSGSLSRPLLGSILVVAQVSLSLVLLVGAGLFIRTLRNLQRVDLGFNPRNLLVFSLQPSEPGFYTAERLTDFNRRVLARLGEISNVQSATLCNLPLLAGSSMGDSIILPGETKRSAVEHNAVKQIVGETYLSTMQIPLLRGRDFNSHDDEHSPRVAIISEATAQKYFPDEDPIGKRVGLNAKTVGKIEIIGIARDTKLVSQRSEIQPSIYVPWFQEKYEGDPHFAVRTAGDPTAIVEAVREAVRQVDSNLPLVGVTTQVAQDDEELGRERGMAELLGFFSLLALTLAAIGIYGLLAFSVARRTGEIGIRMALGAGSGTVLRMVIWQGVKLVVAGLIIGSLGALALKEVIASKLYGVQPADPLTIASVAALLVATAMLACWIPARRAAGVDPMTALRNE